MMRSQIHFALPLQLRRIASRSGVLILVFSISTMFWSYYVHRSYNRSWDKDLFRLVLNSPFYLPLNSASDVYLAVTNTTTRSIKFGFRLEDRQKTNTIIDPSDAIRVFKDPIARSNTGVGIVKVRPPYDIWGGSNTVALNQELGLTLFAGLEPQQLEEVAMLPLAAPPSPFITELLQGSWLALMSISGLAVTKWLGF